MLTTRQDTARGVSCGALHGTPYQRPAAAAIADYNFTPPIGPYPLLHSPAYGYHEN